MEESLVTVGVQQGLCVLDEIVESFFDHTPNNQIVDRVVPVYRDIPKRDDVPVVTDMLKDGRLIAANAIQSLTHDLELALNSAAKLFVGSVVCRWANTSTFIEKDPFLEYPFLEEGIAKARNCEEIDLTTERVLEPVEEAKEPRRCLGRRLSELDKEVYITPID